MRTWISVCLARIAILGGERQPPASESQATAQPAQPAVAVAAKKRLKITVIPKGTTHDFWKSVHAGAVKAARELGNVDLIFCGPEQEDDREQQVSLVRDFISSRVDAIVLVPFDGLVVQNLLKRGSTGVKTAVDHVQGRSVPLVQDTGVGLVAMETMEQPQYKARLSPDLSAYLK